jgi:MFS family permease
MGLDARRAALVLSGAHGVDHLLKRVFPPLVPVWAVAFGFPLWKLGALLGALTLGSALGQTPVGHLSDRYDRRYVLPVGIGLMGLAFVAFPVIPRVDALAVEVTVAGTALGGHTVAMFATLFVVGLGSSTLHPVGIPLMSQNVPDGRKGGVFGMWGSARAFGDGTAPALVGAGLLVTDWTWILVGFGAAGLLYAGYLFVALGDFETRPAGRVDPDEGSSSILGEDRRLYVYPILAVFAAFVLQLVATSGALVFLPEFITSQYGYTVSAAGFVVTPESTASFYYSALLLTAGVVQVGTGRLVDRYDHRTVLVVFLLAGAFVLVALIEVAFSPLGLFAVLVLLGATLWGFYPARDALISDIAPDDHEGRTFGYLWTGALVVSSASPAVVGAIGDVAGLRQAFLLVAGLVVLSTLPVVLLRSDRVYVRRVDAGEAD